MCEITNDQLHRWIEALHLSNYPFDQVFHMVNSETLPFDDDNKVDLSLYLSGTEGMTKDQFIQHLNEVKVTEVFKTEIYGGIVKQQIRVA